MSLAQQAPLTPSSRAEEVARLGGGGQERTGHGGEPGPTECGSRPPRDQRGEVLLSILPQDPIPLQERSNYPHFFQASINSMAPIKPREVWFLTAGGRMPVGDAWKERDPEVILRWKRRVCLTLPRLFDLRCPALLSL
ncbi:hypothetical protein AAFF_G00363550 [Aldrovandia affinis]|uniref:Uncharacterized protein n=1 Tax=Aldrovandia affinis TaxID=143900 RepID=A0AAD7SHN3_9TELE|nr:hypothetical protein AAFF_G00363550 [Aldrovandia affinis]